MASKWNQVIGTANWIFYALMRSLIPGGVILHFFGIPYSGAIFGFSLVLVVFAYRRQNPLQPVETAFWLITAIVFSILQFDLVLTRQWAMVILYGLWILNQQQLEAYLIPGAFGQSLLVSLGMIFVILTATPMVGWEETAAFIQWSIPVYLLSAALMMVRVNLLMVYRQKGGHQINQEKNLLLFNGISMVFFVIGGFFFFSAWMLPSWTSGILAILGQLITWILYPLAVVLAKGSQILKNLILLFRPNAADPGSTEGGLPDRDFELGSQGDITPFMEWAGWIVLIVLLLVAIFMTIRRKKQDFATIEENLKVEEKSFLSVNEIFHRHKKPVDQEKNKQSEVLSRYRKLFAKWLCLLNQQKLSLHPATTASQIVDLVEDLGISQEESGEIVDIYNRVRYRGDHATSGEEEKMENVVRNLEESQKIQ
jgi:hypothetical protein